MHYTGGKILEFHTHTPFFFNKEFQNIKESTEYILLEAFLFGLVCCLFGFFLSQSFNQPGNLKLVSACFCGPKKVASFFWTFLAYSPLVCVALQIIWSGLIRYTSCYVCRPKNALWKYSVLVYKLIEILWWVF